MKEDEDVNEQDEDDDEDDEKDEDDQDDGSTHVIVVTDLNATMKPQGEREASRFRRTKPDGPQEDEGDQDENTNKRRS